MATLKSLTVVPAPLKTHHNPTFIRPERRDSAVRSSFNSPSPLAFISQNETVRS